MSIRYALQNALGSMQPPIATAWENKPLLEVPLPSVPYQRAYLMLARPYGTNLDTRAHWQNGIFQVDLLYPQGLGAQDAEDRAALLAQVFRAGEEFIHGGDKVRIEQAPEIMPGFVENDRFRVTVKIRFYSRRGTK